MNDQYFRKGFGLKNAVADSLVDDYHSNIVDRMRGTDGDVAVAGLTIRLAKEFGFCYGVDRAVEYAYQSREKFPDKRIFLVGEIIHNPHVNQKLERMQISIIQPGSDGLFDFSGISEDDVVLIPAFGVRVTTGTPNCGPPCRRTSVTSTKSRCTRLEGRCSHT